MVKCIMHGKFHTNSKHNIKDNIVRFPTTEISCVIYFTIFRDQFFYLVQIKFELGGGKKLKALWCRNEN